jgi:hypothetical protein
MKALGKEKETYGFLRLFRETTRGLGFIEFS